MGNNRYIPAADPALAQAIADIQNHDRKNTTTGEKGEKGNTSFYDSIRKNESHRPIGLNYNPHTGAYIGLPPKLPDQKKLERMIPFLDDAKNYELGSVSFEGLPEPGADIKTSIYQDVSDLYERNKRFEENISLSDLSDYLNQTYTLRNRLQMKNRLQLTNRTNPG